MELRDRLDLFQDMVQSCHKLYLWEYDRELSLIRSNCPFERTVRNLFAMGGARETLLGYAGLHSRPILMSIALGMMWAAVPEKQQDELRHIHILGPFFTSDRSTQDLEGELRKLRLSSDMLREAIGFLRSLPVISLSRAFEYTVTCTIRRTSPFAPQRKSVTKQMSTAPMKWSRRWCAWCGRAIWAFRRT